MPISIILGQPLAATARKSASPLRVFPLHSNFWRSTGTPVKVLRQQQSEDKTTLARMPMQKQFNLEEDLGCQTLPTPPLEFIITIIITAVQQR